MLAVAVETGWNVMGNRLKELRRQRGLTQQQLAERSGIGQSIIAKIEVGKVRMAEHHIAKLAPALRCSGADLVAEEAGNPPLRQEFLKALDGLSEDQIALLLALARQM
jgi:transcriptional regulator with XRE-family HTH domain